MRVPGDELDRAVRGGPWPSLHSASRVVVSTAAALSVTAASAGLCTFEVYYGTAGRAPEGLSGSLTRSDRAKLSTLGCEQFLVLPGPKSHHQAGLIKTSAGSAAYKRGSADTVLSTTCPARHLAWKQGTLFFRKEASSPKFKKNWKLFLLKISSRSWPRSWLLNAIRKEDSWRCTRLILASRLSSGYALLFVMVSNLLRSSFRFPDHDDDKQLSCSG